jgi:hypothetical protein
VLYHRTTSPYFFFFLNRKKTHTKKEKKQITFYRKNILKTVLIDKTKKSGQVLVADSCILTTQEADQENSSLKPAWANSSQDPVSKKKSSQKKGLVSGSRCRP